MSSHRRKRASRANGSLSQGPVTPEGKQRSSRNATKHGLLSACIVLPGESVAAFEDVVEHYLRRFAPTDAIEEGMVEEMAAAFWRMRRGWSVETKILSDAAELQTSTDPRSAIAGAFRQLATAPELALLLRYETRLHMMYQRALHNILLIREYVPAPDAPAVADPQPVVVPPTHTAPAPSPEPAPSVDPGAEAPIAAGNPPPALAVRNEPNPISEQSIESCQQRRRWWRKRMTASRRALMPASSLRRLTNSARAAV